MRWQVMSPRELDTQVVLPDNGTFVSTAAFGMSLCARLQPEKDIQRLCSGVVPTDVPGTSKRVQSPPQKGTWRFRSGAMPMAALGARRPVISGWRRTDGDVAVVQCQWLSWDARTCALAVQGGHLEMLQWWRAHGCPWDAQTCALAARIGHMEMLQ